MMNILWLSAAVSSSAVVTNLKTEYLENPLGIDRPAPRFQWDLVGDARGLAQVTYQIKVGTSSADGSVWDSKSVVSSQTYQIKYGGPALKSATIYHWSVNVTSRDLESIQAKDGRTATATSAAAYSSVASALFSTGLRVTDWGGAKSGGQFIGPTSDIPKTTCPWFRKTFTLTAEQEVGVRDAGAAALLHLASVGYQELFVNGKEVDSEAVLLPSISYLPKRVLYRTYNISSLLNHGGQKNVVAIWASAGWGAYPDLDKGIATNAPLLLVKLTIGDQAVVVSDASWKVHASNLVSTGGGPGEFILYRYISCESFSQFDSLPLIYFLTICPGGGDAIDDRKALPLWNTATFDDSLWKQARADFSVDSFPGLEISSDAMEPTRRESVVSAATVVAVAAVRTGAADGERDPALWWGAASLRAQPEPRDATVPNPPFCGHAGLNPGGTTTEYEELHLSCDAVKGDAIESISFAVWGVPTGGEMCSSWAPGDPCGSASKTTAWVAQLCVGKSACLLDAIHSLGDPCIDKRKTLAVTARCKLGQGNATAIPSGIHPPAKGTFLVTMHELYTGWFEVKNMKGDPGHTVTFQVSTTAGKPVEFGMTDSFTFGPSGVGDFRMRFAYHEIHYITITGLKTAPLTEDVIGYRLTSLSNRSGDFSCSNDLINRMYSTTVNNYRGLTTGGMSVDCPHRERRGYGGDGHSSYQFALANYPVGAFFNKWVRDFADVQGVPGGFGTPAGTGLVPNTAPTVGGGGGPAWSGYAVTNPWQTYNTFGDVDILADMYPTMVALLAFYTNATSGADGLLHPWDSSKWDFLGDWITPHGSESSVNSPENLLFNNCYLHYITKLVAKIAAILGDRAASAKYDANAALLAAAVNKAFGNASTGVYVDMLQTHAVMPLMSDGLVPDAVAPRTWANFEHQLMTVNTGHLDTGLTGTYFMTKLLMESGRNDLIFAYANKTDFPSYGYFLGLNYTTWPEQWDVKTGDSLMHGCYNAIGVWFIEGVAGIRVHASEEPPLTIRAGVDAGDIAHARGHRAALHGVVSSSWELSADAFMHNVTVPAGGVAKVMVPSANGAAGVTEGGKAIASGGVTGVTVVGEEIVNNISYVSLHVAAGAYRFASTWTRQK